MSAKESGDGLEHWIIQRTSALYIAVYALALAVGLAMHRGPSFADVRALLDSSWFRVASIAFVLSVCWHLWIGMQDVFADYVNSAPIRVLLSCALVIIIAVDVCVAARALWR